MLFLSGIALISWGSKPYARADVAPAGASVDDPAKFAGIFESEKMTLELKPAGEGQLSGKIKLGDKQFPATGRVRDGQLVGQFESGGSKFDFTASVNGTSMRFLTGRSDFNLTRKVNPLDAQAAPNPLDAQAAAPNPLDGATPAKPGRDDGAMPSTPAPGAAAAQATNGVEGATLGAFSVLGSTQTGKTLFLKLPAGQTLEAAITQTADELGKVLDGKPALSGAFAEAKVKSKGGASLTGKLKGADIRGLIFCGTGQNGGSGTVIFAGAAAPKEELATLFNFMPATMKMQTHKFPDGSGSIDLPDGWTTPDQTATYGIGVKGPQGQFVLFNGITSINDPNCRLVRMSQQNYKMSMQNYQTQLRMYQQAVLMHQRFPNTVMPAAPPKPPAAPDADPNVQSPGLIFCQYCDGPEEVLKYLSPVMQAKAQRAGKPYTTLDKVIAVFPGEPSPMMPRSKTGTVYIALTLHDGDTVTHRRALNQITTTPVIDGECWQLCSSNMAAPDETFDRDLPVMSAIINSVNLDMSVVNGRMAADGDALRKQSDIRFQAMIKSGKEFQDRQAEQFADHERQIAAQEKAVHDSASDFIEYIGGVRSVYDNRTGQMGSVDLFRSDAIVDGMNAALNDPGRFVQIPLRYMR